MSIRSIVEDNSRTWQRCEAASKNCVLELQAISSINLPDSYLEFLSLSDGGVGEIHGQLRVELFSCEQLIQQKNSLLSKLAPGFFEIGRDGGDEIFAFDTRNGFPYPVVAIPFTVAEEEIVVVAEDFEYFLALLEGEGQADHWSVSESDWKLRKTT